MQDQRQPFSRLYTTDAAYIADAEALIHAGWRVTSINRDSSDHIIATYGPAEPAIPSAQQSSINGGTLYWRIFGGSLILVVVAACVIASLFAPHSKGGASQTPTMIPTARIDLAATALAHDPTSTPSPPMMQGAQLGGQSSTFDMVFGPEQDQGVWYATVSGQPMMLSVQTNADTLGAITTPDGSTRVWTLTIDYLGSTAPTYTQNAAICRQFMPLDAQHIRDDATVGPTIEHLYRSQILAASFDTNAFQNSLRSNVAPGTFSVFYNAKSCMMATGQD